MGCDQLGGLTVVEIYMLGWRWKCGEGGIYINRLSCFIVFDFYTLMSKDLGLNLSGGEDCSGNGVIYFELFHSWLM